MWVVLPLKQLTHSKQRLASVLPGYERRLLAEAMVRDVVVALRGVSELSGISILSDDPLAEKLAEEYHLEWVKEAELNACELNAVLQAMRQNLLARGVDRLMIIHGDLPATNAEEINSILTAHSRIGKRGLTIAVDRHGQGTNCLLLSGVMSFEFKFGAGSYAKHLEEAAKTGLTTQTLRLEGIGLDIDTVADIQELLRSETIENTSHTSGLLSKLQSRLLLDPANQ